MFFVFFVCNQMLSIRSPLSPGSCMIDVSGQGGEMVSLEELARRAVDCGLKIHRDLGPGMLESVYEAVLAAKLTGLGHVVVRQKPIEIEYEGMILREGFRADLVIDGVMIIELKVAERLAPVHGKQLLTYLKLAKLPLGLLMNFGAPTFREGLKRIINDYVAPSSSPLLVNRNRDVPP